MNSRPPSADQKIMAGSLSTLNAIKTALAKVASISDAKSIRDKAEAIRVYSRQQVDCREIEREAVVVRLRAERRLGELLAKTVRAGNPKLSSEATIGLPPGISRDQSSKWQAVARLPEKEFEAHLQSRNPSTKSLVALDRQHQRKRQQTGPDIGCNLLTGDCQQLWKHLADGSVDLFLTDPPYADIAAYERLAALAANKLKAGGLCLAYSGLYYLPNVLAAMGSHLTYWWTFAIKQPGKQTRAIHPRRIHNSWCPVVAFAKGKPNHDYILDHLNGRGPDKSLHEWQQSQCEAEYLISKLTERGQLVVDPFAGSGTVLAAAKKLGRAFVGCEIDANAARGARRRLAA